MENSKRLGLGVGLSAWAYWTAYFLYDEMHETYINIMEPGAFEKQERMEPKASAERAWLLEWWLWVTCS